MGSPFLNLIRGMFDAAVIVAEDWGGECQFLPGSKNMRSNTQQKCGFLEN
jgi:hypothetical protein